MQLASKIGLISFEKSILWPAAGGNCAICSGVNAAANPAALNKKKRNRVAKRKIMRLTIYLKTKKKTGRKTEDSQIGRDIRGLVKEDPTSVRRANVDGRAGIADIEFIPFNMAVFKKELRASRNSAVSAMARQHNVAYAAV